MAESQATAPARTTCWLENLLAKYRRQFIIVAVILGFLSFTFKEWVPEHWQSLHDDIALNEAIFRLQTDIIFSTNSLVALLRKNAFCVSGGGLEGIPSPPTLYKGDCDAIIESIEWSTQQSRHMLQVNFDFLAHAHIAATEQLTGVDTRLKNVEQRLANLVGRTDAARKTPTSSDPLDGLDKVIEDNRQLQKDIASAHQATLQVAREKDASVTALLTSSKYLAVFFVILVGIIGFVGKRYKIDDLPVLG
jgi:hypothetical protein